MIAGMIKALPLVLKGAALIGAAGFLAFGAGYLTSQWRQLIENTDARGYERGVAEMALEYEQQARALRDQLEEAARARELEIEARRRAAEQRAGEAERRAQHALERLIENDVNFAQCEGQTLPDSVRRHFPFGMLPPGETLAAGGSNGGS